MVIWNNIYRILEEQTKIIKEMTSSPNIKIGKKSTSAANLSSPPVQALTQRKIEGMLAQEKVTSATSTQTVQASLTTIQNTMLMLQESMTNNHIESKADREAIKTELKVEIGEMKTEIKNLDEKIDMIQQATIKNEEKIKIIEQQSEKNEKKLELIENKIKTENKETEEALINLEMDRSSYYLRFQNVEESRGEDLTEIMAEILANFLERDKEEMIREIDDIYRVYTSYARRHRLPKEIHIRFARRKVRDIIYKISREETIKYKEKEIIILKQIPRRVRELRKDYHFLTNYLNKKNIPFRWITPKGILTTWNEKKIKIDDVSKAQEFFEQLGGSEEEINSTDGLEGSSQEEYQQRTKKLEKKPNKEDKEERSVREQIGITTRSQIAAKNKK
uniref:L1 transposable element RRM domain-containing protein n=1 Tax=Micrurus paraensis TaxID=1970185 RepID=A0A2D4KH05_9SAUR